MPIEPAPAAGRRTVRARSSTLRANVGTRSMPRSSLVIVVSRAEVRWPASWLKSEGCGIKLPFRPCWWSGFVNGRSLTSGEPETGRARIQERFPSHRGILGSRLPRLLIVGYEVFPAGQRCIGHWRRAGKSMALLWHLAKTQKLLGPEEKSPGLFGCGNPQKTKQNHLSHFTRFAPVVPISTDFSARVSAFVSSGKESSPHKSSRWRATGKPMNQENQKNTGRLFDVPHGTPSIHAESLEITAIPRHRRLGIRSHGSARLGLTGRSVATLLRLICSV